MLTASQSKLTIEAGETVLASQLPPLRLGSPCTNNILLGGSSLSAVVTRSSRVRATSGLSVYSHNKPSLDILGQARLHTALTISGGLRAKVGHSHGRISRGGRGGTCYPWAYGTSINR